MKSRAQIQQRYVDKLKKTQKWEEFKKKRADAQRVRRAKEKENEKNLTVKELSDRKNKQRKIWRERSQKSYRKNNMKGSSDEDDALNGTGNTGYKSVQALGKAVKKARSALPTSTSKQKVVLSKILSGFSESDKKEMCGFVTPNHSHQNNEFKDLIVKEIEDFFERDDISRVSPKARDTKKYKDAITGEERELSTRHMLLTLKESHAIFCEERKKEVKCEYLGIVGYFGAVSNTNFFL